MALGAATKPGITLENGKVMQHNFYDNLLVRINEVPQIEVHILVEGGKVKGVGEPGLPPFAPALANAIFAVTGKRSQKMPFDLNRVKITARSIYHPVFIRRLPNPLLKQTGKMLRIFESKFIGNFTH